MRHSLQVHEVLQVAALSTPLQIHRHAIPTSAPGAPTSATTATRAPTTEPRVSLTSALSAQDALQSYAICSEAANTPGTPIVARSKCMKSCYAESSNVLDDVHVELRSPSSEHHLVHMGSRHTWSARSTFYAWCNWSAGVPGVFVGESSGDVTVWSAQRT